MEHEIRPRRHALRVLATVALTALLCGCGDVNAGDEASDRLTTALSQAEGVASFDIGGRNELPWSGSVEGSVILEETVDDERIADVSAEICDVLEGLNAGSDDITLERGSTNIEVDCQASRADLLDRIAADDTRDANVRALRKRILGLPGVRAVDLDSDLVVGLDDSAPVTTDRVRGTIRAIVDGLDRTLMGQNGLVVIVDPTGTVVGSAQPDGSDTFVLVGGRQ